MGLVQVATNTVTSAVASVTLTGIDSDDVYMVAINNMKPASDGINTYLRVTKSGTPDTTSNYDRAFKDLRTNTGFGNISSTNADHILYDNVGNATGEHFNAIFYLYNFNNASEYSFISNETTSSRVDGSSRGRQGGAVHTVASASDGCNISLPTSTIVSGTFTLYRVV